MDGYKDIEEHPNELNISTYWKNGNISTLRTALPVNHPENQYNWFRKEYPELNPSYYDIENPRAKLFDGKSREELIDEILILKDMLNSVL